MTRRLRILVADDDLDVRLIAAELLVAAGFDVVTADSGREALDHLRGSDKFAVLITDQSMPGIDGLELLALVAELEPGLPCLLMTGHADEADTAAPILRKPFRAATLVAAVRALL